ncbi:hypothetical protein B296_00059100, partial [Ensete ventricosum]
MRTARYRTVPSKIDRRRPIEEEVDGRLRKKSTVGGRLRKKKGRRRGKEKKKRGRKNTLPVCRPRSPVVVAHGLPVRRCRLWVAYVRSLLAVAFSPARGDGASPCAGRQVEA